MVEKGEERSLIEEHESEETLIEIPDDLEDPLHSDETSISRVPNSICREKKEAYSPQVISIGPLHHDKPRLRKMEKQKLRYLKLFCQRVKGKSQKQVVNHLSRIITESEDKIRRSYYDPCTLNPTDFVKMVLLDSVFIIENLLREMEFDKYEDDVLTGARVSIYFDFILLENLLPYFILERLYDETLRPHEPYDFNTLAESYLIVNPSSGEVRHFVDMLRLSCLSKKNTTYESLDDHKLKYSAIKLHQAGVNFEAVNQQVLSLDVEFVDGRLKMPVLYVNQYFEAEFRNVMAFEQIHHPFKAGVCSFFFFLADLINKEEDVELLVDAGIIVHWLGSNRMFADFINKLCKGMNEYRTCYASVIRELHEHYSNRWHHRKAALRLVYFSNLWRGTATVAAALLLILTLISAISDFKQLLNR